MVIINKRSPFIQANAKITVTLYAPAALGGGVLLMGAKKL
jgi:hypothetical protein